MIGFFKRLKERKEKMKQQAKEDRFSLTLKQLREVMLAIDDYLTTSKGLSRQERRHFWDEFRKRGEVRNDVFNELLNDGDLDAQIKEILCQKKK